MTAIRTCVIVLLALLTLACGDTIINPTDPTPFPIGNQKPDLVEFRVEGDIPLVVIRVSNSLDGLSQSQSVLPFSSTLPLTGRDQVFLSIDARAPVGTFPFGFLHAAIFVNGFLFREASASGLNPVVTASGTWRR